MFSSIFDWRNLILHLQQLLRSPKKAFTYVQHIKIRFRIQTIFKYHFLSFHFLIRGIHSFRGRGKGAMGWAANKDERWKDRALHGVFPRQAAVLVHPDIGLWIRESAARYAHLQLLHSTAPGMPLISGGPVRKNLLRGLRGHRSPVALQQRLQAATDGHTDLQPQHEPPIAGESKDRNSLLKV